MGGSSGSAPKPNPNLDKMSNMMMNWALEDRRRYKNVFQPVENAFVRDSMKYDTPERRRQEATKAAASVRTQGDVARSMQARQMQAMGVNPNSGRYADSASRGAMAEGLAVAGARNIAEKQVMDEGRNRMAQAVNLGQGLAVNPGSSVALGGNLMNQQFNAAMQGYEAQQQAQAGLLGGLGSAVGAGLSMWPWPMPSSKDMKVGKRPARGALKAVENMPVEEWSYKKGVADGGKQRHVGPYAEDFKRETGKGDGKSIPVVDAIGTTMGAIKELSAKVDRIEQRTRGATQRAA